MTCSLPARGGVTYDAVAGAGAGAGRGGVLFVAVAHTVSSQYPQLHCYSFPAPITPPPHCGVGAAAPEAGAGWAVKLLVRVYCVSPRSHTHHHHLSLVTISHHHITTCHMPHWASRCREGPGPPVAVSLYSPQSVSMLYLSPRAALSHDSGPAAPPARPSPAHWAGFC